MDKKAVFYMSLLALQFGMQPTLTRKFTPNDICRSTVILMQEVLKLCFAYFMLTMSGSKQSALTGKFFTNTMIQYDSKTATRISHASLFNRMENYHLVDCCTTTSGSLRLTKSCRSSSISKFRCTHFQCAKS